MIPSKTYHPKYQRDVHGRTFNNFCVVFTFKATIKSLEPTVVYFQARKAVMDSVIVDLRKNTRKF